MRRSRGCTLLVGPWCAAAAIASIRLVVSFFRVQAIRRAARPLAGAGRDVCVCDDLSVPIVAGFVAPAIVIPAAIANELTPANLQRIVAHERAHIRRYDPLCNLIARTIEALLILNPWVYLAGRNSASSAKLPATTGWSRASAARASTPRVSHRSRNRFARETLRS